MVMWEQYKKTFLGIQAVILLIACGMGIASRSPGAALVFFGMMQIGSALGAMWATRLKRMFQQQPLDGRALPRSRDGVTSTL